MSVMHELVNARAALERMRDDVHGGGDECGSHCADYHDAMRAVSRAAEAVGLGIHDFVWLARDLNRKEYGYEEARP